MSSPHSSGPKKSWVRRLIVLAMLVFASIRIWEYTAKQPAAAPTTAQADQTPVRYNPPAPAAAPAPAMRPMLAAHNASGVGGPLVYVDCDGKPRTPSIAPGTYYRVSFDTPCKIRSSETDEILPVQNIHRATVCQIVPLPGIELTEVTLKKEFRKEECPQGV